MAVLKRKLQLINILIIFISEKCVNVNAITFHKANTFNGYNKDELQPANVFEVYIYLALVQFLRKKTSLSANTPRRSSMSLMLYSRQSVSVIEYLLWRSSKVNFRSESNNLKLSSYKNEQLHKGFCSLQWHYCVLFILPIDFAMAFILLLILLNIPSPSHQRLHLPSHCYCQVFF